MECTVQPQITVEEFLNVINHQSANSDNLDQFNHQSRVGAAHPAEGQNSEDFFTVKANETSTSPDHLSHQPPQSGHSDYHGRKESSKAFRETDYEASKLDSWKSGDRSSDTFVIAGLHTCGDLAPTMLRVFSKCAQARALTSVACCYMKMKCAVPGEAALLLSAGAQETVQNGKSRKRSHSASSQDSSTSDDSHDILESSTETTDLNSDSCPMDDNRTSNLKGYPMSELVQSLGGTDIEFAAMELGCHFLESYRKKLKGEIFTFQKRN